MSAPIPILRCDSLDDKKRVIKHLYAGGLSWSGSPYSSAVQSLNHWELADQYPYMRYTLGGTVGFMGIESFNAHMKRGDGTIVNSLDHFISYLRRYGAIKS